MNKIYFYPHHIQYGYLNESMCTHRERERERGHTQTPGAHTHIMQEGDRR